MLLKNFKKVKNNKNLVFYPKKKNKFLVISKNLLKDIKNAAKKDKKNVFVCLHTHPEDKFHNMVIFLWKGTYYEKHKHLHKEEIINMIQGVKKINFHYKKNKIKRIILDTKKKSILRINRNMFHSVEVVSNYVIYHEIKPGPFNERNK